MEAIENYPMQYPVFEADQVLTNDDLNDMFTYLDEQERLTRIKLTGMGIVCGLELQYNAANAAISISKGCGITSWGYLITQDAVTLTYYQNYSVPSTLSSDDQYAPFTSGAGSAMLYELLTDDDYSHLTDQSKVTALSVAGNVFLQDKVVVLYLELNPDDLKNCLSGDCDNKGIIMDVTVKRLLIGKNDLLHISGTSSQNNIAAADELPDLFLQRMNVPATAMTAFEDIYQSYASIFDTSVSGNIIDQLSQALTQQYQLFQPILSEFSTSPFTQVKDTLINYLGDIAQNAPYNIQYYYDFIDDLIKAYNELKVRGHQLISTCCADTSLFPLHLLLGLATVPTAGQEADFRTYFMYSPLFTQQQNLVEELRLLFRRIVLMINDFNVPAPASNGLALRGLIDIIRRPQNTAIKITPSNAGRIALSKRAIPYYYTIDKTNPVQNSWNYRKTNAGKANENLSYNANLYNALPQGDPFINPLNYDIEPYNFFRIEGHIGQNYTTVLQRITDIKNNYRLPFDIAALKLGSDATGLQPSVDCSFSDLESEYELLKSDLYCRLGNQMCYYANLTYSSRLILGNSGSIFKDIQPQTDLRASAAKKAQLKKISTNATENVTADTNDTSSVSLAVSGLQLSDVIKYTSALNIADRALFQLNVYRKGQFLSSLPCFKQSLTASMLATSVSVGQAYLSKIKSGSIPDYQPADFDLLGDYFLKVVDDIEDVISSVYYVSLANFDIDTFTTKMNALISYTNALKTFISNPGKAVIPAGLSDYLSRLPACFNDKLKALVAQYQNRYKKLQQELLFSNFITRHPGIDHKAGVPKGGTFILVYYEAPATATTVTPAPAMNVTNVSVAANPDNISLQKITPDKSISAGTVAAPALQSSPIYNDLINIVQDKKYAFTIGQQNAILGQLKQLAPAAVSTGFQLTDQSVVADFYLPYLCCSGCGGVTYIFQTETTANPAQQPAFSIQPGTFLSNDQNSYPFNIYPPVTQQNIVTQASSPGQLANPDDLPLTASGDSLTLVPAKANVAKTLVSTLQYEGISLTITIIKPAANFTIEITRPIATTNVPPFSMKLSAVDKNAAGYTWIVNNNKDVLKAVADPDVLTQDQIKTLMANAKTLDISLVTNYAMNNVTGSDTKKTQLTTRQITALINKGAQEPKYV